MSRLQNTVIASAVAAFLLAVPAGIARADMDGELPGYAPTTDTPREMSRENRERAEKWREGYDNDARQQRLEESRERVRENTEARREAAEQLNIENQETIQQRKNELRAERDARLEARRDRRDQ